MIKADGLAGGKGVFVCHTLPEALKHAEALLQHKALKEAGSTIVIEHFLQGEELSAMVIMHPSSHVLCPLSQDHKRAYDNDEGPNTGGMGAYAPVDLSSSFHTHIDHAIIQPLIAAIHQEHIHFQGVLYIGLMICAPDKAYVVELNTRFGDPECQALMPLIKNIGDIIIACASGTPIPEPILHKTRYCTNIVLASEGYPQSPQKGTTPFSLPDTLPQDCHIYHGNTLPSDNQTFTHNGGRILSICATGSTLEASSSQAYRLIESLNIPHTFYRKDIGHRHAYLQHPS